MRTIKRSSQFKTDYKRELKGSHAKTLDADLRAAITLLASDSQLPEHYREHALTRNWGAAGDIHIHPDLVLIYAKPVDKGKGHKDLQILRLERIGSHSDLKL
ncbi:MAG: type II toxin-antitoxin system YafQ family toxin [Rhodanobacter sp.]|nr:MAG: type II toxin-antitoxin system YafQ family toxin [Rhodanobacter sp.]TAM06028.1 MAG: type II toxin-antitoxin system YafQ family toxin [Rhodanobacter sp.]TAM39025.1 MAG: type II toxin-antitoxin system YafQ family toxin [Rhodanobacter sp.]